MPRLQMDTPGVAVPVPEAAVEEVPAVEEVVLLRRGLGCGARLLLNSGSSCRLVCRLLSGLLGRSP